MPIHEPDDDMQVKDAVRESNIVINEQIVLTKDQYELLKVISASSNMSISRYIHKAVIETMKTEIEFGDFCDRLLDKLDNDQNASEPVTQ